MAKEEGQGIEAWALHLKVQQMTREDQPVTWTEKQEPFNLSQDRKKCSENGLFAIAAPDGDTMIIADKVKYME